MYTKPKPTGKIPIFLHPLVQLFRQPQQLDAEICVPGHQDVSLIKCSHFYIFFGGATI